MRAEAGGGGVVAREMSYEPTTYHSWRRAEAAWPQCGECEAAVTVVESIVGTCKIKVVLCAWNAHTRNRTHARTDEDTQVIHERGASEHARAHSRTLMHRTQSVEAQNPVWNEYLITCGTPCRRGIQCGEYRASTRTSTRAQCVWEGACVRVCVRVWAGGRICA